MRLRAILASLALALTGIGSINHLFAPHPKYLT